MRGRHHAFYPSLSRRFSGALNLSRSSSFRPRITWLSTAMLRGGKQVSIAIREHPNVSVRTADAPRLIGSATLIAEVEQEGIVSAWASSDPSATGPNQFSGKTDQPIIAGTTSAETVGKKCGPASLRPTVLNLGDLEIPIQNDLNGPLN